jgi:hypothetical protein
MMRVSLVNNSSYLSGFEWDRQVGMPAAAQNPRQDYYEFFDLVSGATLEAHGIFIEGQEENLLPNARVTCTEIENLIMLSRPAHVMGVVVTPREMLQEIMLREVRGTALVALLNAYEHTAHYRHDAWNTATDSYADRLKELLSAEGYLVAESREWRTIYRVA